MRPCPDRIERLPEQYFTTLLARVLAAGEDVIDVGRGNPDVPPPPHVIEALVQSARELVPAVHGYPPFAGLAVTKQAIAERYATVYGVELDPEREVAFLPGTTTALEIFLRNSRLAWIRSSAVLKRAACSFSSGLVT